MFILNLEVFYLKPRYYLPKLKFCTYNIDLILTIVTVISFLIFCRKGCWSMFSRMDILLFYHSILVLAFVVLIFITGTSSSLPGYDSSDEFEQPRSICKFRRTEEVERECHPILSAIPKAKLGMNEIYGSGMTLSFENGDWLQEGSESPLMPFDDSDMPKNITSNRSLLKLVSLWLLGIDFANPTEDAIGFCGVLAMGLTRNRTLPYQPQHWYPWFHKSPGYSELNIIFEGLYVQSAGNEGGGLMCMLGTSVFPFSEGCADFTKWSVNYGCNRNHLPSSMKDDRVMLILQYPQKFTLTSRAIVGEIRSLRKKSDPNYFGNIHISSHLTYDRSSYTFVANKHVPKTCDSYTYQELDSRIDIFQGSNFCKVFQRFVSVKFDIFFGMCNNEKNCSTRIPFLPEEEIERKSNLIQNFRLMIADLHCVPGKKINKVGTAKVSALFRVVHSQQDFLASGAISGLSQMTFSAEGNWDSSSGHLCMIGCVGLERDLNRCSSLISITLPITLSVTQRSLLIGTISHTEGTEFLSPVFFSKKLRPLDLWNRYNEYSDAYLSYQYSKIEKAKAFMKRTQTSDLLLTFVKDMVSNYPGIENADNLTLLSSLSSKLSFQASASPDPSHGGKLPKTVMVLDVLSLGKLLGRYWPELSNPKRQEQAFERHGNLFSADQKLPLNISAHLTLTGKYYSDIAHLHLEGLYDQFRGKMFLIGCRDISTIQHSQIMNTGNASLENKMDCLIEVIVDYSSENTRWLKTPTAKVSIASQRTMDDPLYFKPIRLNTFLLPYADNSNEIRFRRQFEEFLRVLLLLSSVFCLLSQVLYTEKKANAVPGISLVMLTIQVLGYGLPLIMDKPVLFKCKEYHHSGLFRGGEKSLWLQMLDLLIKSLLLILLVLTLRLFQKIWKSRETKNNPFPLQQKPNEYRVFFSTLMIHMIGFLVMLVIHEMQSGKENSNSPDWGTITEDFWVLIQDCFLLPQILGNIIWQVELKPLSKFYYIGFTISRFVVHVYDYLRGPIFPYYFIERERERENRAMPEFFSRSEKVLIMMFMVFLVLVVHVQQTRMKS